MKSKRKHLKLFKKKNKQPSFHKMYLYIVIVNLGLGNQVVELLQDHGSNAQWVCSAKGTATKEALRVLGVEDNRKDVVFAFVDESNIRLIKRQLDKNFFDNKKNVGVAFTIALTSIVGKKVYHFLTNTI